MNPFSKVRSAVLTLNTRTIAEPLLAAAEKTEGKSHHVSVQLPCLSVCHSQHPSCHQLPSICSALKTCGHCLIKRPEHPGCMQKYSLHFSALVQEEMEASRSIFPCLARGSLIPHIFLQCFLSTSPKLLHLRDNEQKFISHNSQHVFSLERCFHLMQCLNFYPKVITKPTHLPDRPPVTAN